MPSSICIAVCFILCSFRALNAHDYLVSEKNCAIVMTEWNEKRIDQLTDGIKYYGLASLNLLRTLNCWCDKLSIWGAGQGGNWQPIFKIAGTHDNAKMTRYFPPSRGSNSQNESMLQTREIQSGQPSKYWHSILCSQLSSSRTARASKDTDAVERVCQLR